MKLLRANTEIREQHYMDAEGSSDEEPSKQDVEKHLEFEGWASYNIDIWYDSMMGFWQWNCDIVKQ